MKDITTLPSPVLAEICTYLDSEDLHNICAIGPPGPHGLIYEAAHIIGKYYTYTTSEVFTINVNN